MGNDPRRVREGQIMTDRPVHSVGEDELMSPGQSSHLYLVLVSVFFLFFVLRQCLVTLPGVALN